MKTHGDDGPAATLYRHARIRTLDERQPTARALLVQGDRVRALYDVEPRDLPRNTRVVDLDGAVLLPGLADAHLHLAALGAQSRRVDLRGCRSEAQAIERVADFLATRPHPLGDPIEGFGWDHNAWQPARFPSRQSLDRAFGERPVVLTRVDGHAAWVSSAVLRRARIGADRADPSGGQILRDSTGRSTGLLVDRALDLITELRTAPSPGQLEADLRAGAQLCIAQGLSAVHAMAVSTQELRALRALERRGELGLRIFVYLDGEDPEVDGLIEQPRPGPRPSWVELRGVKLFADGALGSRGAALLADYSDAPGHRGLLLTEPAVLEERVRRIDQAGYQVAVHAIGDRANRLVLGLYRRLGESTRALRHRVEHAQVLAPDDLGAFAELGVVASMQPSHASSDMRWVGDRLGARRLCGAYAHHSILDSGATLAFGSDAPIEPPSPWMALHAAVCRQDASAHPPGGWLPQQRLSRAQALRGLTSGPAWAVHHEHELGLLRAGALADFVVLDQDPLDSEVSLLDIKVLRCVVAGKDRAAQR